jgi:hypothetical protein
MVFAASEEHGQGTPYTVSVMQTTRPKDQA